MNIHKTYNFWRKYINENYLYHEKLLKIVENICALTIGKQIQREKLPQIMQKDISVFIDFLKSKGIKVELTQVPVNSLKPSQNELNIDKVKTLVNKGLDNLNKAPIFISNENIILDGHHRYFAIKVLNKNALMTVIKINLNFDNAIKQMKAFPKTFSKNIEM